MDHSEKRPNITLFPGRQVRMTSFGIFYAHGDSETTIISAYCSGREGGALEQAIIYIVSSNLMPIICRALEYLGYFWMCSGGFILKLPAQK